MFILGHVGITVAVARAAGGGIDLRLPILLSVLPDILDKPSAFLDLAFTHENTRNVGHSRVGAAIVLAVLLALRARRPMLLWACYLGHFLLDRLWLNDNPIIALWPLLGPFPTPMREITIESRLFAYNILGEFAGLFILVSLGWRHRLFERARFGAFLKTGRLA